MTFMGTFRGGELIKFLARKRGGLLERVAYLTGEGLIEDLR